MEFEKYLRAEQILKEQEIKEAITLIPKILNLCIKKGLDFSLDVGSKVIDVRNLETGYLLTGYYSENLVKYENIEYSTFTINHIYNKVKEYKK